MLAGGCGSSLVAGDSTGSLLDLLAGLGISEDTTLSQLLDQVTVGDVVNSVSQFTDNTAVGTEPLAQAAFQGGPHGPRPGPGAPPPALDLTDEQQQAADQIFQAERDDIDALRAAAQEDIRALLTEEQLALFDELPPLPPGGGDCHGPGGPMGFAGHGGTLTDRLTEDLELSEEQQAAVDEILTTLQAAVQARHEQARDEFLALLTDEQLAQLGWSAETDQDQ
jgi:Spy/CpxP family protein refolding chaperone